MLLTFCVGNKVLALYASRSCNKMRYSLGIILFYLLSFLQFVSCRQPYAKWLISVNFISATWVYRLLLMCLCVCVSVADTIKEVLMGYHDRISSLEDVKFDLEYAVKKKDYEVELCCFGWQVLSLRIYLLLAICVQAFPFKFMFLNFNPKIKHKLK